MYRASSTPGSGGTRGSVGGLPVSDPAGVDQLIAIWMSPGGVGYSCGTMNEQLLRFRKRGTLAVVSRLVELDLMNRTNSTTWQGHEPESCKLVQFRQCKSATGSQQTEFLFTVSYRPRGTLNPIEGNDAWSGLWSDGWKIKHINISRDGILLDANGNPLGAGQPPVIVERSLYQTVDYNLFDFGTPIPE